MNPVAQHIGLLSAGTIATISGKHRYDEIDSLRDDFFEWAMRSEQQFETWQDAWEAFQARPVAQRCAE